MGAVDYWCNLFTAEAYERDWFGQPEIAEIVQWWHLEDRLIGREPEAFLELMDSADVDVVLVPSLKMRSYTQGTMIWDVPESEVAKIAQAAPQRIFGLVGINPFERMDGVRTLEDSVIAGFKGAHLHTYGFGLPINDRRYYPFYAKCVELGVPVVMQVGHSAERMPSALARPILIDDIAIDFPALKIVAAHTGWPWFDELSAIAWKHKNVFIGTSAHHPRYWEAALVQFINGRGRGKVLFGTDFPVVDYADALQYISGMSLREDARDLLVGGAARMVFGLPSERGSQVD